MNFNPRYEQFDIGEGEDAFYLVERLEQEILESPAAATGPEAYAASKLGKAAAMVAGSRFGCETSMREMQMNMWDGDLKSGGELRTWGPK